MERKIRKAAVLGAGVMGAGIAAHLANVGIPSLLLDIVPKDPEQDRNLYAKRGRDGLLKQKPAPLYDNDNLALIEVGNLEDDLHRLAEVDWVIEVVVENLAVKQQVFEKVEKAVRPGTIISSNTSGMSITAMAEGRSEEFRKNFLGTHFFNPPRYMKLLEIIPGPDTDAELLAFMDDFVEKRLGKGVVYAKDTVNFIANRIGTYGLMVTVQEMIERGLGVDDVDALTGPVLGRPKSATFRTLDVVGLDTFVHVSNNVYNSVDDASEKEVFVIPDFMQKMVENGMLGAKTKAGFFKKVGKDILALDYNTLEYRPRQKLKSASLEAAKMQKTLKEKVRALVYGQDAAGEFIWSVLKRTLIYSASKVGEIADDIVNIDKAMKWGFNWQVGPFELWDMIGVAKSVVRMEAEGDTVPAFVKNLLASGKTSFYEEEIGNKSFYTLSGEFKGIEEKKENISLAALKEQGKLIKKNTGASLIDLGDGVAALEFHSLNMAIGQDIVQMMNYAAQEVSKNFRGLVIGNQAPNFCVGANLMMILMEAQDDNWEDLDLIVRQFQNATMALKYLDKPVVAAPFGLTLGGGAEVVFPADKVVGAAETYLGLVEVGVGLLPGGGGNKELLLRNIENIPAGGDLQAGVTRTFETIAMAKVGTSFRDAQKLGYLRRSDSMTVNQDFLLHDAKQAVLSMADNYVAPIQKKIKVVGETGFALLKFGALTLKESGYASDHDVKIAEKIASVITGGRVTAGTEVTEQYLLDLEREAFLSLCGEPLSQQRMQYMLTKGKPLRN
ncbi:3-hydroxyacyl-CoA dehydrogenase NAD-binding domain-containing protein [Tumebacillus sp. DT12]|uniref:3-hydroxyacyl-CoA dehydrogenase NAD-binding domain-containing protein n=1 Tax=Tumebacillus lacus TaxID=2995335 RepID=A0ABT3WZ45_9BACL|nr:3-hydroxyacyl-CoA dehydrogenase/enoyl-CoA hydratase family protein [Tumebacillus lacus]MCX7569934.1 3-hydroxyacyl-CoA dehydrogenase NAD-binding domain-containing protein [Tumebacillus lacus]